MQKTLKHFFFPEVKGGTANQEAAIIDVRFLGRLGSQGPSDVRELGSSEQEQHVINSERPSSAYIYTEVLINKTVSSLPVASSSAVLFLKKHADFYFTIAVAIFFPLTRLNTQDIFGIQSANFMVCSRVSEICSHFGPRFAFLLVCSSSIDTNRIGNKTKELHVLKFKLFRE